MLILPNWPRPIVRRLNCEYGWEYFKNMPEQKDFDSVILAVSRNEFKNFDMQKFCKSSKVSYDVKGVLPMNIADGRS